MRGEPLVGGGLSLDSIDALELVVRLEREFGIKIASSEEARQALASVAALTIYDMCKSVDKGIVIRDLWLERKTGGKSGDYSPNAAQ